MPKELEAKFLNVDVADCRVRLAALGYTCVRPWSLMRRYTFLLNEMPGGLDNSKWSRVRDEGDRITMTYKHAFDTSRIDGTEEVEFEVSDFDAAVLFMDKLGFRARLYQENQRETWTRGDMEVTLNEWPALATFVEVEGPEVESVEAASAELGFDFSTAVFGGVGRIYKDCHGWDMDFVQDLTFEKANEITVTMNSRKASA